MINEEDIKDIIKQLEIDKTDVNEDSIYSPFSKDYKQGYSRCAIEVIESLKYLIGEN